MLDVDLSIGDSGGQAVVTLRGELNLADIPGVASCLIAAAAACGPSLIVDLAGLEGIGYSGLSVLLRVRKWTRRSGGDLLLAAPRRPVRQILQATGLIDVFSVYPSVEQAASSARQVQAWPAARRVPSPGTRRPGHDPAAVCAGRGTSHARPVLSGAHQEGPRHPDRPRLMVLSLVVAGAGRGA